MPCTDSDAHFRRLMCTFRYKVEGHCALEAFSSTAQRAHFADWDGTLRAGLTAETR